MTDLTNSGRALDALYVAPPEPEPLAETLPENTIVWRRTAGESVVDALKRYHLGMDDPTAQRIPGFGAVTTITATSASLDNVSTDPQYQWRCTCGDVGPWSADRDSTSRAAAEHMDGEGDHRAWLEVIEPYSGPRWRSHVGIDRATKPSQGGCVRGTYDPSGVGIWVDGVEIKPALDDAELRRIRGRRSRQNRSLRARGAMRLAARVSPAQPRPTTTITLGGQ